MRRESKRTVWQVYAITATGEQVHLRDFGTGKAAWDYANLLWRRLREAGSSAVTTAYAGQAPELRQKGLL